MGLISRKGSSWSLPAVSVCPEHGAIRDGMGLFKQKWRDGRETKPEKGKGPTLKALLVYSIYIFMFLISKNTSKNFFECQMN